MQVFASVASVEVWNHAWKNNQVWSTQPLPSSRPNSQLPTPNFQLLTPTNFTSQEAPSWAYDNFLNQRSMKSADSVSSKFRSLEVRSWKLEVNRYGLELNSAVDSYLVFMYAGAGAADARDEPLRARAQVRRLQLARLLHEHPQVPPRRLLHAGAISCNLVPYHTWTHAYEDDACLMFGCRWHTSSVRGTT